MTNPTRTKMPAKRRAGKSTVSKTARHTESGRTAKTALYRPHRKVPFPKPGNALYPVPAALVAVRDPESGQPNVLTAAWIGNICTEPPMISVLLRRSRYSFGMLEKSGEFTVNLTTKELAAAADFCGVRSGRKIDKFKAMHLTPEDGTVVQAPTIRESPVSIECRVRESIPLGSHVMFLADVVAVSVDEAYLDDDGAFHLEKAEPIVWSHGAYYALGKELGTFGFSVRKKPHHTGRPSKAGAERPGKPNERKPREQRARRSVRTAGPRDREAELREKRKKNP